MDTVPSHWVATIKKITDQFQKAVEWLEQIHKDNDTANRREAEAHERSQRPNVGTPPTSVEIKSLPPLPHDELAYRKKKRSRERIQFHVGWATLAVLSLYTIFTGYQSCLTKRAISNSEDSLKKTLCQMQAQTKAQQDSAEYSRRALRDNIDSLHQIQRAFINYEGMSIGLRLADKRTNLVNAWQFLVKWENTGSTPAKRMYGRSSFEPTVKPLPRGFDFPDLGVVNQGEGVLAPKGIATTTLTIPTFVLNAVKGGDQHLYIWGWSTYHDAFKDTPVRLTEYCVEITEFIASGDLSNPSVDYNLIPVTCVEHNCYDEDCKDYDKKRQAH
jgi:hypothetical protein